MSKMPLANIQIPLRANLPSIVLISKVLVVVIELVIFRDILVVLNVGQAALDKGRGFSHAVLLVVDVIGLRPGVSGLVPWAVLGAAEAVEGFVGGKELGI